MARPLQRYFLGAVHMTRVKQIAKRFPALSRSGGLLILLMLGLLVASVPGSAPSAVNGSQSIANNDDEDTLADDFFSLLSFEGVNPSTGFPEDQQANSSPSTAATTTKLP